MNAPSGFRRNDGALQRPCSCESGNLRCSGTVRSQRSLLLPQEREGEAARREMPLPIRHPGERRGPGGRARSCRWPWIPAFAGMTAPYNTCVPAKAGTFAVPAPRVLKEGSCFRRRARARRREEMHLPIRHPGESRGPGGRARPCRWLWIPAFAGMTAFDNTCVPAKAGTFAVPAPCVIQEGSCFRRSARERRHEAMPLPIRHPGESRGPGGRARSCRWPWIR